jgi:RNA polymerase sigma-70 factor (ECF subfamily)
VSHPGWALTKAGSPEQIFNLLYNTGFRLTGNHRKTAELVKGAVTKLNGCREFDSITALKGLCSTFIQNCSGNSSENFPAGENSAIYCNANNADKIQEALLHLPVMERLMVVLRDVLGLSYAEMAEMAGLEKPDVARLLSAGRWSLRRRLSPPEATINRAKRAGAVN